MTNQRAITELRKTGWYVTDETGSTYRDEYGNVWFSKQLAMDIGRKTGAVPISTSSGGLKRVVIGYE